jgi:DNA-binding FrmR family transcriptional regulator
MKKSADILLSLKKARSHIDSIITMVEDGAYCIDIIQQMNAVMGYLNSARIKKLQEHLRTCFASGMAAKSEKKKQKLILELTKALNICK